VILFLSVFVIYSFTYTLSDRGLYGTWMIRSEERIIQGCIVENTEASSIIFIGRMERAIYPSRKVIPTDRIDGDTPEEKIEMIAQISQKLLQKHVPAYLYKYHHEIFDDFSMVRHVFGSEGMKLELVEYNSRFGALYRIEIGKEDH